jgi:uncharacterized protein with ParB-like and HNH nuclease domain
MTTNETIIEDIESEELSYRYEITSYGADYPVDSIVKRITDEVIYVPPFQRNFVWNIIQASKFIESLILGLPVPGIFLSKENSTGRLLIVDGQQRLMSLTNFYNGLFKGKEFILSGLNSDLNGKTYKTLNASDRIRLDDSIIHATIVRQDQPNDEESSIYLIFERLNTGGKPLTPQEIRACIYYGEFNQFLGELQKISDWRTVFGKENERLKEQELFLRFFSLYYEREKYQKPLKGFMNIFMSKNRNFEIYQKEELESVFKKTVNVFAKTIGNKSFRIGNPLNSAAFEATMIGLAERLKNSEVDLERFVKSYNELISDTEFIEKTKGGTSDEKQLKERIQLAIDKFATV